MKPRVTGWRALLFAAGFATDAGVLLPDCPGMQTGHQRPLFTWERSLAKWRIYRFER
ncbi:MAG: hypothetical protein HZB20_11635 [Chloroflexi bacterium]|nr:hypothetical protein [Verrucomicrobiota bacterium]MBI5830161.1 hypothetical protein [Chloroflexota bacterium]